MNWWDSEPDDCSCQDNNIYDLTLLGLGPQAAWAYASEPVQRLGVTHTFVNKTPFRYMQGKPYTEELFTNRIVPSGPTSSELTVVGQETSGWWGSRSTGTNYIRKLSGQQTYRVTRPVDATRIAWNGAKGAVGTVAAAGVIDGIFQLLSDVQYRCLSPAQRANRFAVATSLGLWGGLAGAAAFGLLTVAGAPVAVTIGLSFIAGTAASYGLGLIKTRIFENDPTYFGNV